MNRDDAPDEFADLEPHQREHARKVRAVQRASRETEAESITREPFADGWDDPRDAPTANLRLRLSANAPPSIEAELSIADLADELHRVESFCAKVRALLGLPPR